MAKANNNLDKLRNPRPLPEDLRDIDLNKGRLYQQELKGELQILLNGLENLYLEFLCSDESGNKNLDSPFANKETGEISLPDEGELKLGDLCDSTGILINQLLDQGVRPEDGTQLGEILDQINQIRIEIFNNLRARFPESFKKPIKLELNGLVSGRLNTHALRIPTFSINSGKYEIIIEDVSFVVHSSDIKIQLHPSEQIETIGSGVFDRDAKITGIEKGEDGKFIVEIKYDLFTVLAVRRAT